MSDALKSLKAHVSILTDDAGKKAVTESEGGTRVVFVASTASVDRDGEVIEVEAWEWQDGALPKLLWGHDYYDAASVIGKLVRVWKEGGRLLVEAELADKVPGHEKAALIAGLVKGGMLDQGSVGFLPKEWIDPDGKVYTRDNPGSWYGSTPGRRYTKVELLEFSIVAVPSQRDSALLAVRSLFDGGAAATGDPTADVHRNAQVRKDEETRPAPDAIAGPPATPAPSWFATRFPKLAVQPSPAGADLSRESFDRLTSARDALTKALAEVDEALRSAERADDRAA